MPDRRYRVLAVATHPVQYMTPIAFVIFWYVGLLLVPITFAGMATYEDFVLNAYFWLLLGILFRLPTLAPSPQFGATAQPAPLYDPRIRMR
jgi:hypothetical protein